MNIDGLKTKLTQICVLIPNELFVSWAPSKWLEARRCADIFRMHQNGGRK